MVALRRRVWPRGFLLLRGDTKVGFVPPWWRKEAWVTPEEPTGLPHGGANGSAPWRGQQVDLMAVSMVGLEDSPHGEVNWSTCSRVNRSTSWWSTPWWSNPWWGHQVYLQ